MMNNSLEQILESRKINPTAMRILVLKELQKSSHAMSLGELESAFELADKTTLYRTLKTFHKHKLVHTIEDGTGSVKYALCEEDCQCAPEQTHAHFYCNKCSMTYCLKEYSFPSIYLPENFKVDEVSLVIKGLCSNCS